MPSFGRLFPSSPIPFLLLASCLACGLSCRREGDALRIAVPTSMAALELTESLAQAFTRQTGIRVQVLALPSAQALESLARGDVDGAFSHSPEIETKFRRKHPGFSPHAVLLSEFVIAGPAADPAGVRDAFSPADAFLRISQSEVAFISRGDASGTSEFERKTCAAAGISWPKNMETGQGALETLRIAAEKNAYVLIPLASWLQFSVSPDFASHYGDDYVLLFRMPTAMPNPYTFYTACSSASAPCARARAFASFLSGSHARALVQSFRMAGEPVFHGIEVP